MKKKITIFLILIITFLLTGCGDTKASLNTETFKEKLEAKGFTVVDETSNLLENTTSVEAYYIASPPEDDYQLNFYMYTNEGTAQAFYAKQKESLGANGSANEISVGNFSKYTLIGNGKFSVVSRVGSTLLYTTVDEYYRTQVNDLIKEIGY